MAIFDVASIKNAKLQAFRGSVLEFNGGVVFDQGEPGQKNMLRQTRYWEPCDSFQAEKSDSFRLPGSYIYGGPIYNHFGHFMSEMVHRIVRGRNIWSGCKFLFVTAKGAPSSKDYLPSYIKEILNFAGIADNEYDIISEDCTVEHLLVVEAGSDFGGGPKAGYLDELAAWGAGRISADKDAAKRLFVSRARIKQGGFFLGETYIEQWLASAGFLAFHPEKFSFRDQLQAYLSAENIIFSEGSACHGAELLGADSIGRCLVLTRRASHQEIFSRVLQPRSKEFQSHIVGRDLGTALVRTESNTPLPEFSVSLIDPVVIRQSLEEFGCPITERFDIEAYEHAAQGDLDAYIDHYEKNPSDIITPALIEEVLAKFAAEKHHLK